jgi:hypothetical protein
MLASLNRRGAGVFVCINATDLIGRSARNISQLRAVWQDDDPGWQGEFPLTPSIVVSTSPRKFQRLWFCDDLTLDQHRAVQERLAAGLRGGSAWRGNEDSVLICLADRQALTGVCKNYRVIVEKHRDGPEGPIGGFDLPLIELGQDDDDEPFFSRAVQFLGEVKTTPLKEKPAHHHFREALDEVLSTDGCNHEPMKSPGILGPVVLAVPRSTLCSEFKRRHPVNSKKLENIDKAKQVAFDRARSELTGQYAKYGYEHANGEDLIWRL